MLRLPTSALPVDNRRIALGLAALLSAFGGLASGRLEILAAGTRAAAAEQRSRQASFVGAARCAGCHRRVHERWKGARHSKMLQPATAATVQGDFSRSSVTLRGKRYGLRADGDGFTITESYLTGAERERRVEYTLGSRRIQHYLTTLEDGRIVVLPPSWDVERRQWFHNLEIVDPEETSETRVQVWNASCVGCHVSQQAKNFDPASQTYATRWVDFGTSCERCHGPGSLHAERYAGDSPQAGGPTLIVRPKRLPPEQETAVCAQCHSLRDVAVAGFAAGSDYSDHFLPVLEYGQKAGGDPAYWPDGRPRRFSNDALGLWQSRCYLKGKATCTDCHLDPHEPDIERNPQLAPANAALCTGCHAEIGRRLAEHSRHLADGPGSSCVGCHMPKTVLSLKASMADHTISVPVPENSVRFGIPNACNVCHRDRSASWAVQALQRWGLAASREAGRGRRLVERAEAFTLARKADAKAVDRLIAIAADRAYGPLPRANAVGHLRRFAEPRVLEAVLAALVDEDPLVRAVAALDLGERRPHSARTAALLVAALRDDSRVVRMNAGFSLVNLGITRLDGEDGRRLETAKTDFVARAGLLNDDAATQLTLGQFFLLGRDYDSAARSLENLLQLKPQQPGGRYFLALAQLGRGQQDAARRALEQVDSGDPHAAAARLLLEKLKAGLE